MPKLLMRSTVLVIALACAPPAAQSASAVFEEYEVKAAFLYQFTKFIEWPKHEATSKTVLCLYRRDPFGPALPEAQPLADLGAGIDVRRVRRLSELDACDMVFISAADADRARQIASYTAGSDVVLVGESPGFIEDGGIINFVSDGRKIRFEINQKRAKAEGITISSKLLKLASRVLAP